MIPRAKLALMCVYALLAVCGVVSLVNPVESVQSAVSIPLLVKVWGAFYLLGGVTSFVAISVRSLGSTAMGWWYIEMSGLALLATSCTIYASVLTMIGLAAGDKPHILGLACLIWGLACSMFGRAYEAYRIAHIERELLEEIAQRHRRSETR